MIFNMVRLDAVLSLCFFIRLIAIFQAMFRFCCMFCPLFGADPLHTIYSPHSIIAKTKH